MPPVPKLRAARLAAIFLSGAKALNPRSKQESSLPSDRAFVIQFRSSIEAEEGEFAGRAEHLASGQMIRFQTQEELLSFIKKMLVSVAHAPAQVPNV